jgi:hypothetical protein
MNELIEKIKTLTPIEIIKQTDDYADIKLPQYDKDETYRLHKSDNYLYRALRTNLKYNNKVKTLNGLISLRTDIREVINHMLGELAESYIDFNIKEGLYDTDPYSENRLSIYEIELLESAMNERIDEIRGYKPYYLFTYSDERVTFDNINKIIDEMIEKGIIIMKDCKGIEQ